MLLFAPLSSGHIMNWFAVNIPMDLGTGGSLDGEIDIIARLRGIPGHPLAEGYFYRTWEVKVSLLCKDGTTKSLKVGRGKMRGVVNQLKAYRKCGSPEVSLLDVYLYEAGCSMSYLSNIKYSLSTKLSELQHHSFGYHVLPFGYGKREGHDFGLNYLPVPSQLSLHPDPLWSSPVAAFLHAPVTDIRPPFSNLAERIDNFVKEQNRSYRQVFRHTVMFCRECRQLQLIRIKEEYTCPNCGDNLIAQT
jgi:hypothetical protein